MDIGGQRGSTLLETTIAVGILAMLAGAALSASSMAAGAAGRVAVREALQDAAGDELRIAVDTLKYQGAAPAPRTIATSVPMPNGSALPVAMTLRSATIAGGETSVTIDVTDLQDAAQRVTASTTLDQRAPLPGAQLHALGLVPAPTGAP